MEISIIFEDNHLLVVEKPVNIPVQKDSSGDLDLLTLLKADIKERYQKPGNVYLGLVHRLDRPVGGVMVFAKTSKAASRLSDSLRRKKFTRQYLAVVRGEVKSNEATLEHYLVKDQRKNQVYVVDSSVKGAKKAILNYEVVAKAKEFSFLAIQLQTGRPHQIRVQLSTIGYPLYGDVKYGHHVNQPGQQIALWAHKIGFEHPTKRDWVEFTSNPPNTYPWNLWKSK